jgi:hypothetical protein
MPVEEREHVLEIMDRIHDSRLPTGGFTPCEHISRLLTRYTVSHILCT